MELSVKSFAVVCSIFMGGSLLLVGLMDLFVPGYGHVFLKMMASLYPGFDNSHTFLSVLSGTAYGLIDGAVAGALFAWLYNQLV